MARARRSRWPRPPAARRMLEDRGYRVLCASSAEAALGIADSEGSRIDLLVTDIVLPGRNGVELSHTLSERFSMPVLFISGYTETGVVHHGILDPGVLLLQKPFTAAQLLTKVREALDGAGQAPATT